MAKDARSIIIKKRAMNRAQQMQKRGRFRSQGNPTPRIFKDARQVLRQRNKRPQGIQTSMLRARQTQRNAGNFNQRKFNKPFNRPFVQQQGRQRFSNWNRQNRNFSSPSRPLANPKQFAKFVQIPQNGILQVTRNISTAPQVVGSRYIMNSPPQYVMANNSNFERNYALVPVDNGDELEAMTIADVSSTPHSVKKVGHFINPGSSQMAVFNRLTENEPTMVADTVQVEDASSWKVVVSNLSSTVTDKDIVELFSYVGPIKNVDFVQPGTVIVDYFSKQDALKAQNTYHKRSLDGIPMQISIQEVGRAIPVTARLGQKFEDDSAPSAFPRRTSSSYFNSIPSTSSRGIVYTVKMP